MTDNSFGFCPNYRIGNVTIIGKTERGAKRLELTGLPYSVQTESHYILELPFRWDKDNPPKLEELFDTADARCWWRRATGIESLIVYTRKIEMRVLKERNPEVLRTWLSSNPYTDHRLVLMGFDDLMTLMLSC